MGKQIEVIAIREREQAMDGKVIPLLPPVPKLYIAIDGTGVPVVPAETQGRKGKDETGVAKTREAKLGSVFTQCRFQESGFVCGIWSH
jgi:hypothetical protein